MTKTMVQSDVVGGKCFLTTTRRLRTSTGVAGNVRRIADVYYHDSIVSIKRIYRVLVR